METTRIRPRDLREQVQTVLPNASARDLITATHLLSSLLATDQTMLLNEGEGLADIGAMMAEAISMRKHLSAASIAARATVHARIGFDALRTATVAYTEPQAVEGSKSAVKRTRNRKGRETSEVVKYGLATVQGDTRADDVVARDGTVIVSGRILESALTLIPRRLTMGLDAYAVNAITSGAYVRTGLIPRALGGEQKSFCQIITPPMLNAATGTANVPQTPTLAKVSGELTRLKRRAGESSALKPVDGVTPLLAPSVDPGMAYYGFQLMTRPQTDTEQRSTRKAKRTVADIAAHHAPETEAGWQALADHLNRGERVTILVPDGTVTITRGALGQYARTLPAALAERAHCRPSQGGARTTLAIARQIHLALANA